MTCLSTVWNGLAGWHRDAGAIGGGYGYVLHRLPSALYAMLGLVLPVVVTPVP